MRGNEREEFEKRAAVDCDGCPPNLSLSLSISAERSKLFTSAVLSRNRRQLLYTRNFVATLSQNYRSFFSFPSELSDRNNKKKKKNKNPRS